LRELADELKGVASSDLDAKAKQEKVKLLQARIQMVQAEIAAIQRAQQQKQQASQAEKSEDLANEALTQRAPSEGQKSGLGSKVDTYV